MMRGTFANIRIENLMLRDKQGGFTRHYPSGSVLSIYDAAYLELAVRTGAPLATLDTALRRAAEEVGVEVLVA